MFRKIAPFSLSLLLSAAVAVAQPSLHRSFNVAPGGTLTVNADVGDIDVRPGAGGVSVDVFRRGTAERDVEVTFDQQQNDVTVRARNEHSLGFFSWSRGDEVRFVITVPSRYNVQLNTSGGNIQVGDLQGSARCKTSGGNIETARISGPVDARTSGGDVTVDSSSGKLDLHTSGGSIKVRHAGGDLDAHTSGGSIDVDEAVGSINAETSGGSIRARFLEQPHADSRLSTSGGGISVALAPNVALDVDAHTSGGSVDSDLPVTVLGHLRESSLEGKINGGGPRLVLRSSGGGIRLRKM